MFLGTKDAPATGNGSEGESWHRLRGSLDDVCGRIAYLASKQVGEAREIEGSDARHCSRVEAIIVVVPSIQKFDNLLATQCRKFAQQFGRKSVVVAGFDVSLDFAGAGPPKSAEWALALWIVFVLSMALELLGPFKPFLASCAGRPGFDLGAHTMPITVVSGTLGSVMMFSGSQRLGPGHVNMQ
jgi:hypothetical protein